MPSLHPSWRHRREVRVLAEQVSTQAERLTDATTPDGPTADGVTAADVRTLADYFRLVWPHWTLVHRTDLTLSYPDGASARQAFVVLRHDDTGAWLTTPVQLTYWAQGDSVHYDWETTENPVHRVRTIGHHIFDLGKHVYAPTLPALVEAVADQIAGKLGSESPELRRHLNTAQVLLDMDPTAADADAVSCTPEGEGPDGPQADAARQATRAVEQEIAAMRTLAGLGGLGGISDLLAAAVEEHPHLLGTR